MASLAPNYDLKGCLFAFILRPVIIFEHSRCSTSRTARAHSIDALTTTLPCSFSIVNNPEAEQKLHFQPPIAVSALLLL